jgi:uncharacterized membrane protein YbhN (UPF0104 family)
MPVHQSSPGDRAGARSGTEGAAHPRPYARHALTVVKLAISVALLAVLLTRVDASALAASLRRASPAWLAVALGVFLLNVVASTWRWQTLLVAQDIRVPGRNLFSSYLVAVFFNNFLPSNIGGDVVRVRDTAGPAGSKTLATTVVLVDRGIGLIGLTLMAALAATVAAGASERPAALPWSWWLWIGFAAGVIVAAPAVLVPSGVQRLLQPIALLHPEWIGVRIDRLTATLERFRARPGALGACFAGAMVVQVLLVLYHLAVVYALAIPIGLWDLSVIVPVSFIVQMVPVSVNGFGIREATFSYYFARIGLPIESAVLLPLVATALMMGFSLTGAAVYIARGGRRATADPTFDES